MFPDEVEYPSCWDEEYWSEMTDEDWDEVFQKSFFEGIGGD